jgi:hypothetical protein
LLRASDQEQIAFATSQQRVFVTRERRISAELQVGISHAGIVIARSGRRNIGPTVLGLAHLHRTKTAEDMVDQMEYLH